MLLHEKITGMTEEQRKQYLANYMRATAKRVLGLTVQHFKDEDARAAHEAWVKKMQESGSVPF